LTEKEFISLCIKEIREEGIKSFPSDFISDDNNSYVLHTGGKTLLIGNEMFGSYEIITTDGSPVLVTDNYDTAKYVIYSSRERTEKINIPADSADVHESVLEYEEHLKSIVQKISSRYKKEFPAGNTPEIINEIFRKLNLVIY
jgi:hypothetical protein